MSLSHRTHLTIRTGLGLEIAMKLALRGYKVRGGAHGHGDAREGAGEGLTAESRGKDGWRAQ